MTRSLRIASVALTACYLAAASLALAQAATPQDSGQTTALDVGGDQAEPLAWRGSSFGFGQMISANTFGKSSQLSYDPYYAFRFDLDLQWHFNDATYASVSQVLDLELTDSNTDTTRQRPLLWDTFLHLDTELWSHGPKDKHDIAVLAGVTAALPTSLASQAATMMLGTGLHFGTVFTWRKILHGLGLGVDGSYLHRFLRDSTVQTAASYPCYVAGGAFEQCAEQGGLTNTRDVFVLTVSGRAELSERFSVVLSALLIWRSAYELSQASVMTSTGPVMLPDQSATHFRDVHMLRAGVTYHAYEWLGLSLLAVDVFSERSPDGSVRAPLRPVDMLFGLSVDVSLDGVYLAARGTPMKKPDRDTH